MDDLAKRLRSLAGCAPRFEPILTEAVEEIERLRKEAAKLRKSTEWQPIDTAPSGNVLLYYPPEHGKNALSEWITIGLGRSARFRKPTHWMPLPKPPVKEVAGE